MNRRIFAALAIIPILILSCARSTGAAEDFNLSLAYLTSRSFRSDRNRGLALVFSHEGDYSVTDLEEHGVFPTWRGEYRFDQERIYLERPADDQIYSMPAFLDRSLTELIPTISDDSLFFSSYLRVNNDRRAPVFWDKKSQIPEGTTRTVGGVPLRVINEQLAVGMADFVARNNPSSDGRIYEITTPWGTRHHLSEGDLVIILGRSVAQDTIDDIMDFWFLVEIPYAVFSDQDSGRSANWAWVFGGYLEKDGGKLDRSLGSTFTPSRGSY